jgi:hypothetical protein
MIFQNPQNEDQWAYWERVPQMVPNDVQSINEEDHKNRVKKAK